MSDAMYWANRAEDAEAKLARFREALDEARKIGIPTPAWLIISAALSEPDES